MENRKIHRLIESNLTPEEIVKRLTESVQEEEVVQKSVRESRHRKVEEDNEDDDYKDDDEY